MALKVKEVINIIEKKYPKYYAEEWDNIGLLVGDDNKKVAKIQISLDATEEIIDNAIKNNVDMIITHHPLIFKPMKAITNSNLLGKKVLKLIENKIALYSIHTNIDSAPEGLNDLVMKKLELEDVKIISEETFDLFKLEILFPKSNKENIEKEIEKFQKKDETLNFNIMKQEANFKLEVNGDRGITNQVLNVLSKTDKNNEYVSNLIKLENKLKKGGLGRYCSLKQKMPLSNLVEKIKNNLEIEKVRVVTLDEEKVIKKIAVINGSGMSFFNKAKRLNVDVIITGDVKYHEALDAIEAGVSLIDIGHYESEHFFSILIEEQLKNKELEVLKLNSEPVFKYR